MFLNNLKAQLKKIMIKLIIDVEVKLVTHLAQQQLVM